jgi:hypothetical protein
MGFVAFTDYSRVFVGGFALEVLLNGEDAVGL